MQRGDAVRVDLTGRAEARDRLAGAATMLGLPADRVERADGVIRGTPDGWLGAYAVVSASSGDQVSVIWFFEVGP